MRKYWFLIISCWCLLPRIPIILRASSACGYPHNPHPTNKKISEKIWFIL